MGRISVSLHNENLLILFKNKIWGIVVIKVPCKIFGYNLKRKLKFRAATKSHGFNFSKEF